MTDICTPPTDWSCRFSEEDLAAVRATPAGLAQIERAEAFAWSTLASLTAYRIGTCPITVRPCSARCTPRGSFLTAPAGRGGGFPLARIGGSFSPTLSGGRWYNACPCPTSDACSCSALSEIILPGPVGRIVSVVQDGITVDRSAYRVDNGNRLVRTDGTSWPACQDMSTNDGEGTLLVTYYRGAAPNLMTMAAAGALAVEFYKGCNGEECRLPGNVISVNRGGESYDLEPMSFKEGETGIPEVDAVIRIYNPHGLKAEPFVVSPDLYSTRARTA